MSNQDGKNPSRKVGRPPRDPLETYNPIRYNLALHPDDFKGVKEVARKQGTSFLSVMQKFVHIGLRLWKETHENDAEIILRSKDKDSGKTEDSKLIIM